jgi:hypothetical protein
MIGFDQIETRKPTLEMASSQIAIMKLDIEIASDLIAMLSLVIAMLSLVIAISGLEISIRALHITLRKQGEAITWAHASVRSHRDTISRDLAVLASDLGATDPARVVLPAFIQPALPITTSVRQRIAVMGR